MEQDIALALAKAGGMAAMGLGAVGSGFGTGVVGSAIVGAWKKCYAQGKTAPFILITFIGMPLSQTIYGMIMMMQMGSLTPEQAVTSWAYCLSAGLLGGFALLASAYAQGVVSAAAADSLAETGQGFANYLIALGVIETVALFVLVFSLIGI